MKVTSRKLLFSLIALLISTIIHAQERTVYGVVNDHDGNVLSGVTVLVKGTTFAVQTNLLGAFGISAPTSSFVLVVSYIGCKTKEVTVGGSNEYLIELDCRDVEGKNSKKTSIINIPTKEKLNDEEQ